MSIDIGWDWRQKPIGYYEYCICSCGLTRGQLMRIGLEVGRYHSESEIATAWAKYNIKATAFFGSQIGRDYL